MIKTFEQFCAINENIEQDCRSLAAKLRPNITKLVDEINSKMREYLDEYYKEGVKNGSFEITLNNEIYEVKAEFKVKMASRRENNNHYNDIIFKLSKFVIFSENDNIEVSNDMLGVQGEKLEDLFEPYRIKDIDDSVIEKFLYNR
jgi:hypothetical protein